MADERDPKLSQHYRELEALEPPPELDRSILAAARAAQGARAPLVAPAGRHRWYYSLAAAAVLMFAVALTIHIERDKPDLETVATAPAPAPTPAPAPAPPDRAAEERPKLDSEVSKPATRAERFAADPKPQAPAEPARAGRSAAAAPPPRAPVADEMRAQRDAGAAQQAAQAEAQVRARNQARAMEPSAAPAAAPAVARLAPEKPERWLDRIAELRSRGRHAEADKELTEFRRVYPDYRLSEVMRERVEGK